MTADTFFLDGVAVPFTPGQTLLAAAHAAGHYIPHLCWHPDYKPHGSCRLCSVKIAGRIVPACATPASVGLEVANRTAELDEMRRTLLQLLFVEGNHFCPSCEKSGQCLLQATAYELGMMGPHFDHFYPNRPVDASHPEVLLDFNRCILCSLCEQASARDGKYVFVMGGRGLRGRKVIINSASGRLADTDFSVNDRAANICPVGVILNKRVGFATPIGQRKYDRAPVSVVETQQETP